MALSAPGVGSNLDVNTIVKQLMSIEQRPLTLLNTKEAGFQAQLSAYGSLRSALSAFQTAASALSTPSRFQTFSAGSSDASILTATAGQTAAPGGYDVAVSELAQAQSLVATGQASSSAAIGAGSTTTLTFQFGTISGGSFANGVYTGASFQQDGTAGAKTVTIDASSNSLTGIRDAISNARIGVSASIVKDGGAAPYRLVLQAGEGGQARSMRISVSGDAALETLLAHDPAGAQNLRQTAAAQDAQLSINGVEIGSRSNVVADALPGVTLTLAKTGSTKVTVARDTTSIRTAVESFVKAYNELNGTLAELTKFDTATGNSGPLIGDATVRSVQAQIRSTLTGSLSGVGGGIFSVLSQVGVTFQRDGKLTLDSTMLTQALARDAQGVAALFASIGRPSDSLINFIGASDKAQAGSYEVAVAQLATQGKLVGSDPAGLTITAGVNDQFSVTVDGVSAGVSLAAGSYSAASLAAQVQAAINGTSALSSQGISVAVTQAGGVLTIASLRYGSLSAVALSGSAATTLLGATPAGTAGTDAAGTIDGSTAVGSGQVLTGAAGTAVEGLKLEITGGATGARGTVDFSRGYAWKVDSLLSSILSSSGALRGRTEGINRSIEDIDRQRETLTRRLDTIEQRYRTQFTALDSLIGSMQSTSNFLTQQLANLPGARRSDR